MFVNLVRKHGLVPQAAMPETESSSNTGRMNDLLCHTLRDGARELRTLQAQGASPVELRAAKDARVERVYRMLSIHLGTPPERFDWQWNDKDGAFHRDGSLTPQAFAERYVTLPIEDYVCLVHDPRPESPMGRTFTVEYLGNVAGGEPVVYLLDDEPEMLKALTRLLRAQGLTVRSFASARELLAESPDLRIVYMSGYSDEAVRKHKAKVKHG